MRIAIDKANEIYRKHGNYLHKLCNDLGLLLIEEELQGRLKEVYFGDSIVIRKDLPYPEKRELVAHAIGHHLMHAGNHLSMQKRAYSFGNYHERQANVFAAFLLMPEDKLYEELYPDIPITEIAEKFMVTPKLVQFRLKLLQALRGRNGN